MSEIVFYDANATVGDLLSKHLGQFGLVVVRLDDLSHCEEVLKKCCAPKVLLLDMSRSPEMLPQLQAFVPGYIRTPDRCILTSVAPTGLAKFLPQSPDLCFFKHVIERPFKKNDFLQFLASIVEPKPPRTRKAGAHSRSFAPMWSPKGCSIRARSR